MYDSYDPSDNLSNETVPLFVINILPAKIDKVYYLIGNAENILLIDDNLV